MCLTFRGTTKLFSKVAAPFYTPTSNIRGFQFLHFLSVFFVITILRGMKWDLTVIWICISLVTDAVEYIFMCLLAVFVSSLEICLFRSFANFYLGYLSFINEFSNFFVYSRCKLLIGYILGNNNLHRLSIILLLFSPKKISWTYFNFSMYEQVSI